MSSSAIAADWLVHPRRENLLHVAAGFGPATGLQLAWPIDVGLHDLAQSHALCGLSLFRGSGVYSIAHRLQDALRLSTRLVLHEQPIPANCDYDRFSFDPSLRDEAACSSVRHSQPITGHAVVPVNFVSSSVGGFTLSMKVFVNFGIRSLSKLY